MSLAPPALECLAHRHDERREHWRDLRVEGAQIAAHSEPLLRRHSEGTARSGVQFLEKRGNAVFDGICPLPSNLCRVDGTLNLWKPDRRVHPLREPLDACLTDNLEPSLAGLRASRASPQREATEPARTR